MGILLGGCGNGGGGKERSSSDSDISEVHMTRKAKIHESHLDTLFNFGFAFFDSPVESNIRAKFEGTKVPVLFYGSGPPSGVPGSENA